VVEKENLCVSVSPYVSLFHYALSSDAFFYAVPCQDGEALQIQSKYGLILCGLDWNWPKGSLILSATLS
jgi:hypothetical protein